MRLFGHHRHREDDPIVTAPGWAVELFYMGLHNTELLEKIMSAADDLKAAIADLATELTANNAEIDALLTKIGTPGTSDADIAAAVTSIRDLIASNKTEVDKAKAAVP
jgi:hypothetical protein